PVHDVSLWCRVLMVTVSPPGARAVFAFSFFFNDTATTEIYPLSLPDALPIWIEIQAPAQLDVPTLPIAAQCRHVDIARSEEHTSELQSLSNLVCRLLFEK